ncbi:MDR family MFS transporter [[Clostridium] dakarense]|uniref:MDR family MFS transporter n=1 Tax=Faecalimicrobium dakarense TaxID=1301100 RepID=UPI0004B80943|nr:MDR family MFS transporter [[Clostridium] dakarense]
MSNSLEMTDKKRNLIFINILISCIATSLLSTALATALLPITKDIGIDVTTGQWLTSGFSLALGIIMPLTAFLIRRFPTKRLYLAGIGIFLIGLLICAFATNFPIMMIGRVLQACGNGLLLSMAQVVILTIFPNNKKGTAMGWYGLATAAAPVIAPTLAGILIDTVGWRSIFFITMAIMLVSLVFAISVFDNILETQNKKFDAISFAISIFAFGGITLGIGNIAGFGFISTSVLIPLIVGIITSILFVYRQFSIEQPFLDLRVLKFRKYTLSVIGSMLLYLILMGTSVIMPLYIQSIMGYSATISGLVTLPGSLAMTVVSPFTGKLFDKIGMKKLFIIGALFMFISNIGMVFISMSTPIYIPALYHVIRSIAIACLMMPLVTWGTNSVDKSLVTDATALLTSLRTIAGAIGAAMFVGVMSMISTNSIPTYGKNAPMHGLNVTFFAMSIVAVILLVISVFFVDKVKNNQLETQ